ncbi:MAG: hypothetical protein J0L64_08125 [Acidobacteria bacterium]|nr:hypothetical protein [Acidobacteriota bacterium]
MMRDMPRAIVLLILPAIAWAQTITPATRPEPRLRVYTDPAAIARYLLSPSEETRRLGFRQMGVTLNFPNNSVPDLVDVRLLATNLDDDQELERVLIYSFERRRLSAAHVFDFDGNAWWCVGEFDDNEGSELIELKGATMAYHDDLVVRVGGHGTGVVKTQFSIYRLWAGRLYRIFQTTERHDYDTTFLTKPGPWRFERRLLYFPLRDETRGSVLVAHHTRLVETALDTLHRPLSLSCVVYRWDRSTLSFVRDSGADEDWCVPASREPQARVVAAIE